MASRARSASKFAITRAWAPSSLCWPPCFSLFLLSLLGLPATGGFLGKFFAFQAALDLRDPRFVWLVVIAAINSVIGAYYYLRVIIVDVLLGAVERLHAVRRSRPPSASP